jgi:hypothetical protein
VAIWSLALGILGLWPLTFIASVPALILGYRARRQILRSAGCEGGLGLAYGGITLGWLGVAILALILVLAIAYAASCSNTNCG